MKVKNEILKQMRIYSGKTVAELSACIRLTTSYIERLEAGNVENLDYIYPKYATALRVKEGSIKRIIFVAEKECWDSERIKTEVIRMLEGMW